MKKIITFFLIIFLSGALFNFVSAGDAPNLKDAGTQMNIFAESINYVTGPGIFDTSIRGLLRNIMLLVNTLFFIFMIYAGILWLVSSGEEAKITKAKTIILWSVVGVAVTLGSYAITDFILKRIGAW